MTLIRKIDNLIFGTFRDQYAKELEKEAITCESLLDLGCGNNSPIKYFSHKIKYTVGVDLFEPYIEESRAKGIHSEYIKSDVMTVDTIVGEKSYDIVIASDLIEHLEKEEGFKLIELMTKIAKKKVVVFTPNGFQKQGEYDGNDFQVHKSGWEIEEFKKLGFKILGINGWKPLRGEYALPTIKPKPVGERLSFITQPFVKKDPTYSYALMAVKELS